MNRTTPTLPPLRPPDKTRYLKAVRHIETAEIPFFETEVDFTHVARILGQDIPPLRSYLLPAAQYREFLLRTGMDMAYLHVPWKFGRAESVDARGLSIYTGGLIKDPADLKLLTDPGTEAVERRIEEMLQALDGTGIGTVYALLNANGKVREALGYERYFMYLADQPGFIREFLKRADAVLDRQEAAVLRYPVDAVQIGGAPCMKTGLAISLEMIEEFVFPYLQRAIDRAHAAGKIVSAHTDGNHTALFERYIAMGIDVAQAVEKCSGAQDIFKLKAQYGDRLAFHGSIDVEDVLMKGSVQDVTAAVKQHIQVLGHGGGYICASSHDIHQDVPTENFLAMIAAITPF